MAFGKPYLFYLINPDTGDYYYVDNDGEVQQQSDPIYLKYAPDKWRDTEIKWTRSKTFWGLFRNFSTPYTFVEDGRKILKKINDEQGVTGKCKLLIEQIVTTDGSYTQLYSGDLDFSKLSQTKEGIRVNIMEGGLIDLVYNNAEKTYEIPIEDIDSDLLLMDGVKLSARMDFIGTPTSQPVTDENEVPLPLAYVQQDGEYWIGEGESVFPGVGAGH